MNQFPSSMEMSDAMDMTTTPIAMNDVVDVSAKDRAQESEEEKWDDSDEETPTSSARRKYDVVENTDELPARMKLLLDSLAEFYQNGYFETIVWPIVNAKMKVNTRLLDWFVTNYSLAFPVVYPNPKNPDGEPFNVHDSYEQYENVWKKKLFDPFKRGQRIMFTVAGVSYETTIAQLNFFRWAIQFGVIQWTIDHKDEIQAHHKETKRVRRDLIVNNPNREKRRQRLTETSKNTCLVYVKPIKVNLNSGVKRERERGDPPL
jgi:hypothetical protein